MLTEAIEMYSGCSPQTSALIDKLKDGAPGDVLRDEDLTVACGRDTRPQQEGYNNLRTAISFCLREYQVVWERAWGGKYIKCLDDTEKMSSCRAGLRTIKRRSRKNNQLLRPVKLDGLEKDQVQEFNALMAQNGTVALFASADTTKKLAVRLTGATPDPKQLLELFK